MVIEGKGKASSPMVAKPSEPPAEFSQFLDITQPGDVNEKEELPLVEIIEPKVETPKRVSCIYIYVNDCDT